jgi:hypothetical protein
MCLLELLWLVSCTFSQVLKWVLLPSLDLHRFGLPIFQLEYSLIHDVSLGHSPIYSFFLMAQPLVQAINYSNHLWHYRSNRLFLWNNVGYLTYPIHQPKLAWWGCKLYGYLSLQLYITHLYFLLYKIWFYRKGLCLSHARRITHSKSILHQL